MRFLGTKGQRAIFARTENLAGYEAASAWLHHAEGFSGRLPTDCPVCDNPSALAQALGLSVEILDDRPDLMDCPRIVRKIAKYKYHVSLSGDKLRYGKRPLFETSVISMECGTVDL